jgi:hypothetical protein
MIDKLKIDTFMLNRKFLIFLHSGKLIGTTNFDVILVTFFSIWNNLITTQQNFNDYNSHHHEMTIFTIQFFQN